MSRRSVNLRVECLEERLVPSSAVSSEHLTQSVSNQMLAGVMPVLTTLDTSLTSAFQDYNGHKALAIKDILAADKQLAAALDLVGASNLTSASTASTTGARPVSQAASDAVLSAALPVLQSAITTLEQADSDYGGHKATAIQDLIAAETQLNEAIAYSAAHDKNVK
jgi:hypothetical protein